MIKTLTATYGGYLIKQDEAQQDSFAYVKNIKTNESDLIYLPQKRICLTSKQLRRYLKYLLQNNKLPKYLTQKICHKNEKVEVITEERYDDRSLLIERGEYLSSEDIRDIEEEFRQPHRNN